MVALAVLHTPELAAQAARPLTVNAIRFYRADGNKTIVKAFVEVPAQLAEPVAAGRTDSVRYDVVLRVLDSAGVTLHSERWGKTLANLPGASGVDIVEFLLSPGKYRLEATVDNAAGQRRAQSAIDIEGYRTVPAASDLLLAPMMRVRDAAVDSVPLPGYLSRGNTLIAATAMLHLTPLQTHAYYLLEAYNPSDLDQVGSMRVAVIDSSARVLTETKPVPVRIGRGGGLLQGQIDVEGLPEGRYQMKVSVTLGDKTLERSAAFTMAPLEATMERNAVAVQSALVTDEGYFAALSDEQLDSAAAPLGYVAKASERSTLRGFAELSPAAKRRFLTQFWKSRDPDPATDRNELRERFYQQIDFANRSFGEGTNRSQPGWKTDRGRVYAKNGAPDDVLRRPAGNTVPYEVWHYTRGKSRYYIFADRSGFGAYNLMATNDLTEQTFLGWRDILKEQAVTEIGRYLGVDFYSGSESGS
jgi:GWxTD domain-containing protein